ncbi:hypothetical protein L2E82_31012 [Cichorium intybus]|uniref:Uncharacterized protein n=1 Tax=Cichorium intybus TaxID=13427 RepID=A0ACB9D1T3_CICIN|nr:hypothetical protein L2E82_31012 [Cichorium intybus]
MNFSAAPTSLVLGLKPNSKLPIEINGTKFEVVYAIGSSGLDMKTDPSVPIVYAGFGVLMLTTCISYLSHTHVRIGKQVKRKHFSIFTSESKAEDLLFSSKLKDMFYVDCE